MDANRQELLEELHLRYADSRRWRKRWVYLRKKYVWLVVTSSLRLVKRLLDIALSLVLLCVLSPLMLIVSVLIKATDNGPILYVSERIGRWGRPFRFPKFRSMIVCAESQKQALPNQHREGITFKMKKDPRVTWIGLIIRKTSIDELPQLWCVLKGEMSLVGPRPPLKEEVSQYSVEQRRRLDVLPGITCLWQVSGRADIPFDKQVKLDMQYIESQSVWNDIYILCKTVPAVIFGKGAY